MLIERLRRKVLALNYSRTNDEASTYPDGTFIGPMVALLDGNSASDGDIFPAMFREAGLGPLIGKRSWGGVVGISNHGQLIDGGTVNVPESGFANKNGEWIIEGYGVDPDIEVDNDPQSLMQGKDMQLERAIAELMRPPFCNFEARLESNRCCKGNVQHADGYTSLVEPLPKGIQVASVVALETHLLRTPDPFAVTSVLSWRCSRDECGPD